MDRLDFQRGNAFPTVAWADSAVSKEASEEKASILGKKATRVPVRPNWYFNGLAMDRERGKKEVLENHFSAHKRETKELMEVAEIHPRPLFRFHGYQ